MVHMGQKNCCISIKTFEYAKTGSYATKIWLHMQLKKVAYATTNGLMRVNYWPIYAVIL